MTKEERHRYYASREWAILKQKIRERSEGICERCYVRPMDQVHHLTYARFGHEPLEDLQAICDPCHLYESGKSNVDPAWREAEPYEPIKQAERCVKCFGPVHEGIARNGKGQWFCSNCAEIAEASRHA